ncbi:MAG: hypothetical protein ACKO3C_05650 [Betaproteobacteria bacterium]
MSLFRSVRLTLTTTIFLYRLNMPRKRTPRQKISTGKVRMSGVAGFRLIALPGYESSMALEILNLAEGSPEAKRALIKLRTIISMALSAREIYRDTRPERSRSKKDSPAPVGKPSRHYREILAADLAELLMSVGMTPLIVRTTGKGEKDPSAAWNRLLQLVLKVIGEPLKDSSRSDLLSRASHVEHRSSMNSEPEDGLKNL